MIDIAQYFAQLRAMQTITYAEARDNLKRLMDKAAALDVLSCRDHY